MAFLDNIGKKVSGAAQAAAKKSSELVETTKLNISIGSEEEKIKKLYGKMGKKVFEEFCSGDEVHSDLKDDCEAIKTCEKTIKDLKAKIMEVKNVKSCSNCGVEMEMSSMFCAKCGTKQEIPAPAQQQDSGKLCPSCNASLQEATAFCTSCGAKIS